ncbi:MAG: DUF6320 domain-containing protein [Rectinemataceae bacterium]
MPYCPECGVELEPTASACPLCGTANARRRAEARETAVPQDSAVIGTVIGTDDECPDTGLRIGLFAENAGHTVFTPKEQRKIVWEMLAVGTLIAIVTLSAINLLVSRRLSWSFYPMAALGLILALATAFLMCDRKPVLRYLIAFLAPPAFLLAIDAAEGGISWSWALAVPLAFLTEAITAILAFAIRKARRKSINLIAFVLFGVSALCLGIDTLTDIYMHGAVSLSWSPICALALVPIAIFLLYLHFRVIHSTNLRRMYKL